MKTSILAVLLSFSAASAGAQETTLQPLVDTPAQRQSMSVLTACLAQQRPRWARQTLAQPYLSQAQARLASYALSGRDTCVIGAETEVTFRTSTLVASLAEHYVREELDHADFARVSRALSTTRSLNVSEDFALCVASRNPAAARALTLSAFGSAEETTAAQALSANVAPCTNAGEHLTVDVQALRALTATALYRAMNATEVAQN